MPARLPAAEVALRDLQRLVRRPPNNAERPVMQRRLPPDLATDEAHGIGVLADEVAAAEEAARIVREDLRFEHLDHPDDAVWRFVEEGWARRPTDHVPWFVERHAHEVTRATCYLPVEFLTVATETKLPCRIHPPWSESRHKRVDQTAGGDVLVLLNLSQSGFGGCLQSDGYLVAERAGSHPRREREDTAADGVHSWLSRSKSDTKNWFPGSGVITAGTPYPTRLRAVWGVQTVKPHDAKNLDRPASARNWP